MKQPGTNTFSPPRLQRSVWLVLALVLAHLTALMLHFAPAISTPDAHGYFAQARRLATVGRTSIEPESLVQYLGPHWRHTTNNQYYTTFAPGFPALLAVVFKVFGPSTALVLNPLLATLTLLGLYFLGRVWLGESWALLAAVLLAANPMANEHALFGDAHTSLTFFLVWGLFLLVRWGQTGSLVTGMMAGCCLGLLGAIRYPEVLLTGAAAVYALWLSRARSLPRRSLAVVGLGMVLPLALVAARNQAAFGAFWKTGYGLMAEPELFAWRFLASYWAAYVQQLLGAGVGLSFVLGLIGIVALCAKRDTRREGELLALLVVPVTVVYMAYFFKPDPQSMRFLLPTFPIYIVAAVWLCRLLLQNRRALALVAGLVLVVANTAWGLPRSIRNWQVLKHQQSALYQIACAVEKHVEPGSVIITGEAINQHLDFLGRWRLVDVSLASSRADSPPDGLSAGPLQPSLLLPRNVQARERHVGLPANERFGTFAGDVWAGAGSQRKVYVLLDSRRGERFQSLLPPGDRFAAVTEIALPTSRFDRPVGPDSARALPRPERPRGPMGPDHVFDLRLDGRPLHLVQWLRS